MAEKHQCVDWAKRDVTLYIDGRPNGEVYVMAGDRRRNVVRMRCSYLKCRAYRFAYFNTAGEFIRFGPIRYERKAGQ